MNVSDRLPASLIDHAGMIVRSRCLSERRGRSVYLCLNAAGQMRIFKVHTGLDATQVDSYLKLLVQLSGLAPGSSLLPILGFGHQGDCVWEELPLADHVEEANFDFETYSPVQPSRLNHSERDQSLRLAVEVGNAVCDALLKLSRIGLVHGDVKPSNVVRIGGRWFLGDFETVGSASKNDEPTPSTEGYVPPEAEELAARDSYALGKLLYELWTGCDRLEFPTVPPWLMKSRWNSSDRLLNETICRLCSPLSSRRLKNLQTVKVILGALGNQGSISVGQARKLLGSNDSRRVQLFAALSLVAVMVLAWCVFRISRPTLWNSEPVVFYSYKHPEGVNEGYVRWTSDGIRKVWMLFNTHATLRNPLQEGDEVELALKKEVWRGHVGLYLSRVPFYSLKTDQLSHRERFGGLDYFLFFHVDGDSLVAPTVFRSGVDVPVSSSAWNVALSTNSLATYRVRLSIQPTEYRWSVSVGGVHLADGKYPRNKNVPEYLNVYTFDNTMCYLSDLSVKRQSVR